MPTPSSASGGEAELAAHRARALGDGRLVEPVHGPLDRDGVRAHERRCARLHDGAVSRSMRLSMKASTESRKLLQCCWVWKPTMLDPSSPAISSSRQGQMPDALRVGPGDVPERDDRRAGQPLADHLRREGEVVVLHQDDGVVGVDLLAHGVGEPPVDRT
jgi:hypothetical protein